MLAASFRVAGARLIPRRPRSKQAPTVGALLLSSLIFAGCGGSGAANEQPQALAGAGFRFAAPTGWRVERAPRRVSATRDDELVQVVTFPLVRPYRDGLYARVEKELRRRVQQVAQQTGGTVSKSRDVVAGGIRSHSYDVAVGEHVDQYTFVLRGRREFQLLCRRKASSSDEACAQLIRSFRAA